VPWGFSSKAYLLTFAAFFWVLPVQVELPVQVPVPVLHVDVPDMVQVPVPFLHPPVDEVHLAEAVLATAANSAVPSNIV